MVTAEMAVALPSLILVLGLALAAVVAVTAQLRCVDAAREGARAAARGESTATVLATARRASPAGSTVRTGRASAGTVSVEVAARLRLLGAVLPAVHISARAVAEIEPGAVAPVLGSAGR